MVCFPPRRQTAFSTGTLSPGRTFEPEWHFWLHLWVNICRDLKIFHRSWIILKRAAYKFHPKNTNWKKSTKKITLIFSIISLKSYNQPDNWNEFNLPFRSIIFQQIILSRAEGQGKLSGSKITEENVLPVLWHSQMIIDILVFLDKDDKQ